MRRSTCQPDLSWHTDSSPNTSETETHCTAGHGTCVFLKLIALSLNRQSLQRSYNHNTASVTGSTTTNCCSGRKSEVFTALNITQRPRKAQSSSSLIVGVFILKSFTQICIYMEDFEQSLESFINSNRGDGWQWEQGDMRSRTKPCSRIKTRIKHKKLE